MGGTTEETDVLGQWLASRQAVRGGRVAAPAEPVTQPATQPVTQPVAEQVAQPVEQPVAVPAAPAPGQRVRRVHPLAPKPDGGPSRPDVEFAPRNGTQRVAGALLVATTAGWALTGWWAWERASPTWAGVAAIVGLLAVGLWFLRAASAPPRVRITGGTPAHRGARAAPHLGPDQPLPAAAGRGPRRASRLEGAADAPRAAGVRRRRKRGGAAGVHGVPAQLRPEL